MKKNLLSIMAAGLIVILMSGNASAQVAMNNSLNTGTGISTSNNDEIKTGVSAVDVDFRTLKDFKKRFKTTTDAVWYETKKGHIVKFSANSIKTTVAYGKHGKWFHTIQRYDEKCLPKEVRARVKSTYYDYTILHIDEVSIPQQENAIYVVLLSDKKNLKSVRVCGDEMEVIAHLLE